MTTNSPRLLTPKQAAALLKISTDTLLRWRIQGYGPPSMKLGERFIRFDLAELEAWVAAAKSEDNDTACPFGEE